MKWALLSALSDGPGHGYELIQRIEERTDGRWKPSPGSVYPTLQMLDDGGSVKATQQDDKRVYEITEAGQAELAARTAEVGGQPWMRDTEAGSTHGSFRHALGRMVMASKQVAMAGNPEMVEQATEIIDEARRKLYRLLSES
jgi:DNA-binding PadR family transcriptional regulator